MNNIFKKRLLSSAALLLALLFTLTSCAEIGDIFGDFANSIITAERVTIQRPDDMTPPDNTESDTKKTTDPSVTTKIPLQTSIGQTDDKLPPAGEIEIPAIPSVSFTVSDIPKYSGDAYTAINDNIPFFERNEYSTESYEYYSELDKLGRCGLTVASVGKDIMPTEDRGDIGSVKPSGWQSVKYDFVSGKYLYNRCHLIGFQLTGENANKQNLITGTRYLNIDGMLPFENMVADYVKETGNHVLYRVTPIFEGDDLVAKGVLMEGYSVEDNGDGVCFCVFAYNVQPGVAIDYATGESEATGEDLSPEVDENGNSDFVLNINTKRIHIPSCQSVTQMSEKNRKEYTGTLDALKADGYVPCGSCMAGM